MGRERVSEKGWPLLGLAAVKGGSPTQSGYTGRGKYAEREREIRSSHSACSRFTIMSIRRHIHSSNLFTKITKLQITKLQTYPDK